MAREAQTMGNGAGDRQRKQTIQYEREQIGVARLPGGLFGALVSAGIQASFR